jgi:hypothetical protein
MRCHAVLTCSFATAEQIGEFVATLVSDKQGGMGWMTGSDVVIDGGYTLY